MSYKPTISLMMIVRDETEELKRCLESIYKHVDEIVVGWNGKNPETKKVLESFNVKIYPFVWKDDFAYARNFVMEKCTKEWLLWADSDDVFRYPEKIKRYLNPVYDVYRMRYSYQINKDIFSFDRDNPDGYSTTLQWRERIVKNNGAFVWKGRVHETLCSIRDVKLQEIHTVWIDHNPHKDKNSDQRNIQILLKEYEETKPDVDPRTLWYLGLTYFGMKKFDEAQKFFQEYIPKSGWDEQRYIAQIRLGDIFREKGLFDKAVENDLKALSLMPEMPDAYLGLGVTYFFLDDYKKSIHWIRQGMRFPIKSRTYDHNPRAYTVFPLLMLVNAYIKDNKIDEALAIVKRILQIEPHNKNAQEQYKFLIDIKRDTDIVNSFLMIADEMSENRHNELAKFIPKRILEHPLIVSFLKKVFIRKESTGKDVTIFCGQSSEDWCPKSTTERGIGGSEEAVIYLAQSLQKKGFNVVVYNSCNTMEGIYDGVEYIPFYYFNPKSKTDYFISWRLPHIFNFDVNAKKKYLWLHDVPAKGEFTKERLDRIDKIIVLSKFHRKFLDHIPEEKISYSTNGVKLHTKEEKKRNNHRLIYSSSPDRGLEQLLDVWPEIIKEIPDVTLHVYYGWQTFDAANKHDPSLMDWKKNMEKKLKQKGIFWKGRVSHPVLEDAFRQSGVWPYYCTFPEISCITAMKAQMLGAIPITTDFAAMPETVKYGVIVSSGNSPAKNKKALKEWTKKLIDILRNDETTDIMRKKMIKESSQQYSWDNIADDWIKLFEQ